MRGDRYKQVVYRDLQRFASRLGWPRLRTYKKPWDDGTCTKWYEAGVLNHSHRDFGLFGLVIQPCPQGQESTYAAIIFAMRFRICSGWYAFERAGILEEATRLEPCLAKKWFSTLDQRRQYRKMYPQCSGLTRNSLYHPDSIEQSSIRSCLRWARKRH